MKKRGLYSNFDVYSSPHFRSILPEYYTWRTYATVMTINSGGCHPRQTQPMGDNVRDTPRFTTKVAWPALMLYSTIGGKSCCCKQDGGSILSVSFSKIGPCITTPDSSSALTPLLMQESCAGLTLFVGNEAHCEVSVLTRHACRSVPTLLRREVSGR